MVCPVFHTLPHITRLQTSTIDSIKEDYLKGVLDAVSWLSDPYSFEHPCVSQLSEHQAVIETQWQLRDTKEDKALIESNNPEGWLHSCMQLTLFLNYLLSIGANALDKVGLGLIKSLHQLIKGRLEPQTKSSDITATSMWKESSCQVNTVSVN